MRLGRFRIHRSRVYRTFIIEWDTNRPRCIVGITGNDRPSLLWHLRGWLHA